MQFLNRIMTIAKNNKGFTLIEMAIVLIIIGIIIGAVVKGKDIIRSGEQKKIYSKFFNEWRLTYVNYYDRSGRILGDISSPPDNQADGTDCVNLNNHTPVPGQPHYGITQIGLSAPTTNSTDTCTYRYTNSEGGAQDISITFNHGADNNTSGNYNYMQISNIPLELALAIDRMVDGQADGTTGDFIRVNATGALQAWIQSGEKPTDITSDARWKMQF